MALFAFAPEPTPAIVAAVYGLIVCLVPLAVCTALALILFGLRARIPRFFCRTNAIVAGLVALCYVAGGFAGWEARPAEWTMSLLQTMGATVNAVTLGHELEHQAEDVMMYFMIPAAGAAFVSALAAVAFAFWRYRRPSRA